MCKGVPASPPAKPGQDEVSLCSDGGGGGGHIAAAAVVLNRGHVTHYCTTLDHIYVPLTEVQGGDCMVQHKPIKGVSMKCITFRAP